METTGFILLGLGVPFTIAGYIKLKKNYDPFDGVGYDRVGLLLLGVAFSAGSIPLIFTGIHYKRKAKLILNTENISRTYHIVGKKNLFSIAKPSLT